MAPRREGAEIESVPVSKSTQHNCLKKAVEADAVRLRQIELVIRDAKQHTGLTHYQARSQEKLDFHLNVSVAAVNVLRLLSSKAERSPHNYRREAYNRLLIGQLFSKLGISAEHDRTDPRV